MYSPKPTVWLTSLAIDRCSLQRSIVDGNDYRQIPPNPLLAAKAIDKEFIEPIDYHKCYRCTANQINWLRQWPSKDGSLNVLMTSMTIEEYVPQSIAVNDVCSLMANDLTLFVIVVLWTFDRRLQYLSSVATNIEGCVPPSFVFNNIYSKVSACLGNFFFVRKRRAMELKWAQISHFLSSWVTRFSSFRYQKGSEMREEILGPLCTVQAVYTVHYCVHGVCVRERERVCVRIS